MTALATVAQGSLRPALTVTWTHADGTTPEVLTGANISGWIKDLSTDTVRPIQGTFTVTDGANGVFAWNLDPLDVATDGTYEVQFAAAFAADPTPARTAVFSWEVATSLAAPDSPGEAVDYQGVVRLLARTTDPDNPATGYYGLFVKSGALYLIDEDGNLTPFDDGSTAAAAAIAAHVAESDPHTQYLTESDAASTYSGTAHTHDYAASGHSHAGYSATGHTHDYAATDHAHAAYSTTDHTHAGYAVTGHDHSGTYATAAHSHDYSSTYAASVHSHDYAASSHSHDYAATGHTHSGYAADTHNHDSAYSASGHNHSGVYATTAHNHDSSYSATGHNHDSAYSASGHSHDYSSTYAALVHNHDGAYSAAGHTHDYAASGHNHTGTYATAGHDHAGTYAPASVTQYTDEMTQDAAAGMITGATHSGLSVAYDDAAGKLAFTVADQGGIAKTLIDAKGDLIVGSADNTAARLAVGANGYLLTADSGATNGVAWAAPVRYLTLGVPGTLTAAAGTVRLYVPFACTVTNVRASVGTAPTGASVIVDVNKNGVSLFTTQANRPTITATNFTDLTSAPDVTAIAADDYLTIDVDQIGSTVAGADLVVTVCVTVP